MLCDPDTSLAIQTVCLSQQQQHTHTHTHTWNLGLQGEGAYWCEFNASSIYGIMSGCLVYCDILMNVHVVKLSLAHHCYHPQTWQLRGGLFLRPQGKRPQVHFILLGGWTNTLVLHWRDHCHLMGGSLGHAPQAKKSSLMLHGRPKFRYWFVFNKHIH